MPEDTKLLIGDIPGLTAEQRQGFAAGAEAIRQAVRADLGQHILAETDVDRVVQKALRAELDARLPVADATFKAEQQRFRADWLKAQLSRDPKALDAVMTDARNAPFVQAAITSGSTTYSNVTPTLVYSEIIGYLKTLFWHRQYCRVLPGSPKTGIFPVGSSTRCTAYRRSEGSDTSDSAPQMGGHTFTKMPLSVGLPVSDELLNEWAVPVLYQWFLEEMGYALGSKEFTEFQTGTNSSQWEGIETASITAVTGLFSDEMKLIRKLLRNVPRAARAQAVVWGSSNTLGAIENLSDDNGNAYFKADSPTDRILGKPLLECEPATDGLLYAGWLNRYHIYEGDSTMDVTREGRTNRGANQTYMVMHTTNDAGVADTNAFRKCSITVS